MTEPKTASEEIKAERERNEAEKLAAEAERGYDPSKIGPNLRPPRTLNAALAALQAQLPTVRKTETAEVPTKSGGKYSYSYATLADLSEVVMPLMGPLGLSFITMPTLRLEVPQEVLEYITVRVLEFGIKHDMSQEEMDARIDRLIRVSPKATEVFELQYSLRHSSGESLDGHYPLPDPSRATPQEIGSAITYARRYVLGCVTGISVTDDDDGKAASSKPARGEQPPPPSGRAWDLEVMEAQTLEGLREVWNQARQHAELSEDLKNAITERGKALQEKLQAEAAAKAAAEAAEGSQEPEPQHPAVQPGDEPAERGEGSAALDAAYEATHGEPRPPEEGGPDPDELQGDSPPDPAPEPEPPATGRRRRST